MLCLRKSDFKLKLLVALDEKEKSFRPLRCFHCWRDQQDSRYDKRSRLGFATGDDGDSLARTGSADVRARFVSPMITLNINGPCGNAFVVVLNKVLTNVVEGFRVDIQRQLSFEF